MQIFNSLSKGLKLKVRKFWGLITTFVEVTGEKLVGGGGGVFRGVLLILTFKEILSWEDTY